MHQQSESQENDHILETKTLFSSIVGIENSEPGTLSLVLEGDTKGENETSERSRSRVRVAFRELCSMGGTPPLADLKGWGVLSCHLVTGGTSELVLYAPPEESFRLTKYRIGCKSVQVSQLEWKGTRGVVPSVVPVERSVDG